MAIASSPRLGMGDLRSLALVGIFLLIEIIALVLVLSSEAMPDHVPDLLGKEQAPGGRPAQGFLPCRETSAVVADIHRGEVP